MQAPADPEPARAAPRSPRSVARLLYGLVFIAAVGQTAIVPLLPRLAAVDRLSTATTAMLIAAPGAATCAVALPAGMAADRFGARRVTLGAGVLLALGVLAQARPGFGWLLGGRLVFGVAYGVVWTTAVAWIARAARGDASGRQAATVTSAAIGVAAGPAFGALLAARAGLAAPFVVAGIAAGALTAALLAASAGTEAGEPGTSRAAAPSLRSLSALARAGRDGPGLASGALALAMSGATNSVLQLLVPLQLHHAGASTESIGLAFSCAAGLYIAVSALVVRLGSRAVTSRTNALAALVLALALFPAGSSGTVAAVLLTLMLTVAPRATVSTIAYPLATGDAARAGVGHGAAVGLLNGAWAGAMVAASLAAGALSHAAGLQAAWLTTLAAGAVGAAWLVLREVRPGAAVTTS